MTRLEPVLPTPRPSGDPGTVAVTTLDDVVAQAQEKFGPQRVTFVKIDVETMEMEVLKGASGVLEEHHPQLSVELITDEARAAAGEFLEGFGYQIVGRFCATPTYHFINPQLDALRKPRSRLARWWHGLITQSGVYKPNGAKDRPAYVRK